MEKTEVFLKDKVVLDKQGQPRKAFYDLTVYKDARSALIAQSTMAVPQHLLTSKAMNLSFCSTQSFHLNFDSNKSIWFL